MKTIKIILTLVTILLLQGCTYIRGGTLGTFPKEIHIEKEGGVVIVKVFHDKTEETCTGFMLNQIEGGGEDSIWNYYDLKDGEDATDGWITLRDFKGKSRNGYMEVVIGSNYNNKERTGRIVFSVVGSYGHLSIKQD